MAQTREEDVREGEGCHRPPHTDKHRKESKAHLRQQRLRLPIIKWKGTKVFIPIGVTSHFTAVTVGSYCVEGLRYIIVTVGKATTGQSSLSWGGGDRFF